MKSVKPLVVVALTIVFLCGVVSLVIIRQQAKQATAMAPVSPPEKTSVTPPPAPPAEPPPAVEEAPPAPSPPPRVAKDTKKAPAAVAPPNQGQGQGDPPPTDILAREALSFVGMDAGATAYWVEAINDPDLPAEERSNLIEDLNEDGLPDPKYPTMEDLPLIMSRLRLIEELVADSMDQVNLDAFAEAYKDLLNLADLARGGGVPVK